MGIRLRRLPRCPVFSVRIGMEVWHKCQVAWGLQASKVTGLCKSLRSRLALVQMVIRPPRQEPQSRGLLQVALASPRAAVTQRRRQVFT